jgi:hypothetical protein
MIIAARLQVACVEMLCVVVVVDQTTRQASLHSVADTYLVGIETLENARNVKSKSGKYGSHWSTG